MTGPGAMPRLLLVVAAVMPIVVGCTSSTQHTAAPGPTTARPSAAARATAAGCPVTTIRTSSVPAAVLGFTAIGRQPGATTWMGNDRFVAVLFYSDGRNVTMPAGGGKILWWTGGHGDQLVIHGREAATGRTFVQSVTGIGAGQFPSSPAVPRAGCWTLTADVGGTTAGSITIPVGPAAP